MGSRRSQGYWFIMGGILTVASSIEILVSVIGWYGYTRFPAANLFFGVVFLAFGVMMVVEGWLKKTHSRWA